MEYNARTTDSKANGSLQAERNFFEIFSLNFFAFTVYRFSILNQLLEKHALCPGN